jgi:hypothetical protein
MYRDKVLVSKEMRDVKIAQWERFASLAAKLPDHHVLAVELTRTFDDRTAAIFTVVRNRKPVRSVVFGDARGQVKPPHECQPEPRKAMELSTMEAEAQPQALVDDPDQSPNFSLAQPPVQQDPSPGLVALASSLLPSAFNVGEHVEASE